MCEANITPRLEMLRAARKLLRTIFEESVVLQSELLLLPLRNGQAGQIHAFESLAPRFSEVLSGLERVPIDFLPSLVLPFWQEFNAEIARQLRPKPRIDFLRMKIMRKTIAPVSNRASYFQWYKNFLSRKISSQLLWRLLDENYVGKPIIAWPRARASFVSTQHLFHIAYLHETTGAPFDDVETVVEWGGGYGNFCKILLRYLGRNITYVVIDTPLMTTVQWLYLSSILGPDNVQLLDSSSKVIRKGVVNLVPLSFINNIDITPNFFVSTWALSESSPSALNLVDSRGWLQSHHVLIALRRDDSGHTCGNTILSGAKRSGLSAKEMEFYPNNYYVTR